MSQAVHAPGLTPAAVLFARQPDGTGRATTAGTPAAAIAEGIATDALPHLLPAGRDILRERLDARLGPVLETDLTLVPIEGVAARRDLFEKVPVTGHSVPLGSLQVSWAQTVHLDTLFEQIPIATTDITISATFELTLVAADVQERRLVGLDALRAELGVHLDSQTRILRPSGPLVIAPIHLGRTVPIDPHIHVSHGAGIPLWP